MSVARLSCMLVDKIGFLMKERVYACIGGANGRVGLGSTGVGAVWQENRLASKDATAEHAEAHGRCTLLPKMLPAF